MKNHYKFACLLALMSLVNTFFAKSQATSDYSSNIVPSSTYNGTSLLEEQPSYLAFEQNKGQVTGGDANDVTYFYKSNNLSVFLLKTGIAYQFNKIIYPKGYKRPEKFELPKERKIRERLESKIRRETFRMDISFIEANPNATIITEGASTDYVNYYNYNALDVHSFTKITYQNIYPNIDWVIYKHGENIKYDFVIKPGGDPNNIKFHTQNVENLKISTDGDLVLGNRLGSVSDNHPISYQNNKEIATHYKMDGDLIYFEVAKFDPEKTLIIDPTVEWATYYGGVGNDQIIKVATYGTNAVYAVGHTASVTNIASGGYQNTLGGGIQDAFIVKFNNLGVRQWATYYGGTGSDVGNDCVADNTGAVYLCGTTTTNTAASISSAGFQNTYGGGQDAFLVKFNSAGFRIWATYYGGNGSEAGNGCAVNSNGNVYLTGTTGSASHIASGGFQNTLAGDADAFLVKFDSSGNRIWGTYYGIGVGGAAADGTQGNACAVNPAGDVFMIGCTATDNGIAFNGYQNTKIGYLNSFIVKFNSAGSRIWGSYYGGDPTYANACAVDGNNAIFLSGMTEANNHISTSTGHQPVYAGDMDAFLVKFDTAGVRQWGTYYGGDNYEQGRDCDVDASGNSYLSGYTQSITNISTGNQMAITHLRAFLVKFNSAGVRQWGTYFGDTTLSCFGFTCAVDPLSAVYLGGVSDPGILTTAGAHQPVAADANDGFLVKFDGTCPSITTTLNPSPKLVCSGDTVMFIAGSSVPVQYQWKVNSGSGFVNLANNINYSGATNDTLIIYNVPYSFNGYNYQCEFSISTSCPVTITTPAQLTVNQRFTPTFSLPTSICQGGNVFLLPTISANNISGTWSPSTVNNALSGTYIFTPNPVAGQCFNNFTLNVIVTPSIIPAFSVNTDLCLGGTATVLPATSLNGITGTWLPATISNTSSGAYTFSPSSGQCTVPATLNITVHSPSNGIDTKHICTNDLPYTWNGIPNSTNGMVYHTISVYGCDSTVTLDLSISPPSITTTFDTSACGSIFYDGNEYTQTTTVTKSIPNAFGCDSIVKIANLIIYPNNPILKIIDTLGCDEVVFEGNTYTANTTLTNVYHNSLGCDSLIRTVNIIVVHFELNLTIVPADPYEGERISLNSSANVDNYTVTSWLPSTMFPDQENLSYSIFANKNNSVSISGMDSHGCKDTASVSYIIKPLDYGIFIPNAFTPNGDGNNDVFTPRFYMKRAYLIKSFRIFDRWGKNVYSSFNSLNVAWDGKYSNQQPADLGNYSYYLVVEFIDGKTVSMKGNITLLR